MPRQRSTSEPDGQPTGDPAEPARDAGPPGERLPGFEPIAITSHRALAGNTRELLRRLNANPELAILLMVNPALAIESVGAEVNAEIRHHILHTLQHPPALRKRRDELIAQLTEALGERPRPNEPAWVARALFEKLTLTPLDTRGQAPGYHPAIAPDTMARLNALRPKARPASRYQIPRERRLGAMSVKPAPATPRRLDLDATLPDLPRRDARPETITLEELYFYKDSHPLARALLELGIIERQGFPIQTSASFRAIQRGEKRNAFTTWVKRIRFPVKERA